MAKKRERVPVAVAIDRYELGATSGLDAEGKRWTMRGAPVDATVAAIPGRKGQARYLQTIETAGESAEARCEVFGTCGGCTAQTTPLQVQRRHKQELVERTVGSSSAPIRGDIAPYGMRNKLELSFGTQRYLSEAERGLDPAPAKSGHFLGFHPAGWFGRIVPVRGCPLGTPAMNRVISVVAGMALTPAWDNRDHHGFWRHLVLRQGDAGVLVALVTAPAGDDAELIAGVHRVAAAIGALPDISGVLWVETDRVSEVAHGPLRSVLVGKADLEVTLAGKALRLSWDAFFQVTTRGAEILLDTIAEALGGGGTLLDLYCGTGAIGLAIGSRFQHVVGIDLAAASIEAARNNAERLGIPGTWIADRVEAALPRVLEGLDRDAPLHAVVDPPRAGLHPDAAHLLAGLWADTLVYVSCNVGSLARDRQILERGGWRLDGLWTVDLFPQTPHVEAVARFVRA